MRTIICWMEGRVNKKALELDSRIKTGDLIGKLLNLCLSMNKWMDINFTNLSKTRIKLLGWISKLHSFSHYCFYSLAF